MVGKTGCVRRSKSTTMFLTMPINCQEIFIGKEAEKRLSLFANLDRNRTLKPLPEPEISTRIKDVDGVIVGWGDEGLSEGNLEHAKNLRIIGVIGSSVRKVYPEIAFKKKITIVNTAKVIGDCVAEHTLGFILTWSRRIVSFNEKMKAGKFHQEPWTPIHESNWDVGSSLKGKNIGLVGMGIIGKRVVELLRPFGVKIRTYSPHFPTDEASGLGIELTTLKEVLEKSDVISIHAGLTKDTFHLIGKRELNLIKEGAIFINTARARIVDEKALIFFLKKKKIYAALDVYSEEPLSAESELRRLPNVILTPHTAGHSRDVYHRLGISIVKDFELFFSGKPPLNALSQERVWTMT